MSIKAHTGDLSLEERDMIDIFRNHGNEYPLPSPIDSYLRSLGDFRDGSNALYLAQFDIYHPNRNGHFNRISAENHYIYESFPAPIFVATRVVEDYQRTLDPNRQRDWTIPVLTPEEDNHGLPTANLLGWYPSRELNLEQRQILEDIGLVGADLPVRSRRYYYCQPLMDKLSTYFREATTSMKMGAELHDSRYGSAGQQIYLERNTLQDDDFVRTEYYADGVSYNAGSFPVDGRIDLISMVMSLRVKKEPVMERHQYACYDFNEYQDVPLLWQQTRNTIFERGNVERLNFSEFS